MASYPKPSQDLPIFNNLVFGSLFDSDTADGIYLRLTAQTNEDMAGHNMENVDELTFVGAGGVQTEPYTGSSGGHMNNPATEDLQMTNGSILASFAITGIGDEEININTAGIDLKETEITNIGNAGGTTGLLFTTNLSDPQVQPYLGPQSLTGYVKNPMESNLDATDGATSYEINNIGLSGLNITATGIAMADEEITSIGGGKIDILDDKIDLKELVIDNIGNSGGTTGLTFTIDPTNPQIQPYLGPQSLTGYVKNPMESNLNATDGATSYEINNIGLTGLNITATGITMADKEITGIGGGSIDILDDGLDLKNKTIVNIGAGGLTSAGLAINDSGIEMNQNVMSAIGNGTSTGLTFGTNTTDIQFEAYLGPPDLSGYMTNPATADLDMTDGATSYEILNIGDNLINIGTGGIELGNLDTCNITGVSSHGYTFGANASDSGGLDLKTAGEILHVGAGTGGLGSGIMLLDTGIEMDQGAISEIGDNDSTSPTGLTFHGHAGTQVEPYLGPLGEGVPPVGTIMAFGAGPSSLNNTPWYLCVAGGTYDPAENLLLDAICVSNFGTTSGNLPDFGSMVMKGYDGTNPLGTEVGEDSSNVASGVIPSLYHKAPAEKDPAPPPQADHGLAMQFITANDDSDFSFTAGGQVPTASTGDDDANDSSKLPQIKKSGGIEGKWNVLDGSNQYGGYVGQNTGDQGKQTNVQLSMCIGWIIKGDSIHDPPP